MAQERKDSWTPEDDNVLAETVLRQIREGGTQLAAFEEAGERLERTAGACGFRWNSEVRKRYEIEIRQAKAARRESKSAKTARSAEEMFVTVSKVKSDREYATDYLDQIIQLANKQKLQIMNMAKQIKQLSDQLAEKDNEVEQLNRKLEEFQSVPTEITVNEDYRTLLQILQRARQIGAIDDESREKHLFKMDASGNIEFVG